jgi:hypothetical protein
MAIGTAVQNGAAITIYSEEGKLLAAILKSGDLVGYTSTIVTVRNGNAVTLFNDKGKPVASIPAAFQRTS